MAKTNALGRGLDSLLGANLKGTSVDTVGAIAEIKIGDIEVNPNNPRKDFSQDKIDELAANIKQVGIIQAITVRKIGNKYQIISGERRFRAAQQAGLTTIPAYIRVASDIETLVMAISENLQRTDLNPIELAIQYKALIDSGFTQEQVAEQLGKSRSVIANQVRLLLLPAEIQLSLQKGELSTGHTRPLLAVEDKEKQLFLFKKTIAEQLSVRQLEQLAYPSQQPRNTQALKKAAKETEIFELTDYLETKVYLQKNTRGKGKILISFFSDEELKHIIAKIMGK
ncbi:MAG: ParB/RepB/Spo0J family partition protein [Bacteroidales bacterium]|jgi:ParB family chromosome partitioning protein|nr:ParB/RepB/Spo0J family partition protein [Bacteroidales bacterium]